MPEAVTVYTLKDAIRELRAELSDLREMVHDMRPQLKIMRGQLSDHQLDHVLMEDRLGEVCEEKLAPFKRAMDEYMIKLDQAYLSLNDDLSAHIKECLTWGDSK